MRQSKSLAPKGLKVMPDPKATPEVSGYKEPKDLRRRMEHRVSKALVLKACKAILGRRATKAWLGSAIRDPKVVKGFQAVCRVTKVMSDLKAMTGLVHKVCRVTKVTLVQPLAPPLLTW